MGVAYVSVQWNRQKGFYDAVLVAGVGVYLALFGVVTKRLFPLVTDEIMLMRAFGTAAFLLLHIILCIGPLCRLNPRFLPLLYNRRHAGVTCCRCSASSSPGVSGTCPGRPSGRRRASSCLSDRLVD